MRPGKTIGFKGVDGTFTLELIGSITHARVLLVAGGVGITPMRVLLAERLARQLPVTLLYFVRSPAEAPFLQELVEVRPDGLGFEPRLQWSRSWAVPYNDFRHQQHVVPVCLPACSLGLVHLDFVTGSASSGVRYMSALVSYAVCLYICQQSQHESQCQVCLCNFLCHSLLPWLLPRQGRFSISLPAPDVYSTHCCLHQTILQVFTVLQAAHNSHGLFALAVSITRLTEQSTAHASSAKSDPAISWHQGRITKAMLTQVKDCLSCYKAVGTVWCCI